MRRLASALFAVLLALRPGPAGAFEVEWVTWGNLLTPPDVHQSAADNSKLDVYLRGEVVLKNLGERTDLLAYGQVALIKDRNRFSYNNKAEGALGIALRHKFESGVQLSFGARWAADRELSGGRGNDAVQATVDASLYRSFRPAWLSARLPDGARLILSGWANFRYPASVDPFERRNGLAQGALKLGLDLPWRETKAKVSPFVSLTAKWDIRKRSYNNSLEPALGVDLKHPLPGGGSVAVGLKGAMQFRTETGTRHSRMIGYITWYKRF